MRATAMIVFVLLTATGICRADDPLESLNTVEETLSQFAQYRSSHISRPADSGPPQDAAGAAAADHPSDPEQGVPPREEKTPQGSAPACCQ